MLEVAKVQIHASTPTSLKIVINVRDIHIN
jgi:hypothetical protein